MDSGLEDQRDPSELKNEFRDKKEKKKELDSNMEDRFQPIEDRVLCRLEKAEEMQGGIIIPDSASAEKQEATVIAVGPGRMVDTGQRLPMSVRKGMRVILPKYGGTDVKLKEAKYQIIFEKDILGVIGETKEEEKES